MSVGFQSGRSDDHALESFAYPLISPVLSDQRGEFCLRIKARGSAITSPPDWIQLQMFAVPHPHRFEHYSLGGHYSIVNPAESDNEDMLSVGAAAVSNTSQIWDDSSRGPMVDGTLKPDIVGAHLVNSVTYGNLPFAGTSQAAPHVGGLAALVVQALTNQLGRQPEPTRVAGFLKRHAIDRGTRGPDNTWGFRLRLPAHAHARTYADADPDPYTDPYANPQAGGLSAGQQLCGREALAHHRLHLLAKPHRRLAARGAEQRHPEVDRRRQRQLAHGKNHQRSSLRHP